MIMKEVRAYIKPHRLSAVTLALHEIEGLTGLSVSDVRGCGRGRAKNSPRRFVEDLCDFIPGVRIEIICEDALVDEIVETVQREAHTGLRGDGKIYVFSRVEEVVRISTGQREDNVVK
jgi:nitrogen regulatory protein P-II 1